MFVLGLRSCSIEMAVDWMSLVLKREVAKQESLVCTLYHTIVDSIDDAVALIQANDHSSGKGTVLVPQHDG